MSSDFVDNSAVYYGGGLYSYQASPACTNSVIATNTAYKGGGVYCRDSSPPFVHCTFNGNARSMHGHGGGAYCHNSYLTFNSSIIAFSEGEGIYFYFLDFVESSKVKYCDFWNDVNFGGNVPDSLEVIVDTNANGDPCDAFLNIFLEPMFADVEFRLEDSSHCNRAADPATGVTEDFEGDRRPSPPDTLPDIGADEHWSACSVDSVTIQVVDGNAVLMWPQKEGWTSYMIYGSLEPFTVGVWLATVMGTTWTDEQTSIRPSPYFYYVTTGSRGSVLKRPCIAR